MYEFQRACHLCMLWITLYFLSPYELLFVKVTKNTEHKSSDQKIHCFTDYCYETSDVYAVKKFAVFCNNIMLRVLLETLYENFMFRMRILELENH